MRKVLAAVAIACTLFATSFGVAAQADDDKPSVIWGTKYDDVIRGNRLGMGAQTVYALAGDDRVWGGVGFDKLYGGPGDDRLHNIHASGGLIVGGGGFDTCFVGVPREKDDDDNVTLRGCEQVEYVPVRGHGNGDD